MLALLDKRPLPVMLCVFCSLLPKRFLYNQITHTVDSRMVHLS
jgi:hypothetical protein